MATAWPFLKAVYRRFSADEATVLAGYIAYASMLSGMPFLIFAVSVGAFVIGETGSEEAIAAMFKAVPRHVGQTIEPVLRQVLENRSGSIATISLLGTLWAASNGVEAIRTGLDRAYDVAESRGFLQRRIVALVFVLIGFVTFASLAILIVFAPLIFHLIELLSPVEIPGTALLIRYAAGGSLLIGFLWLMHRLLPSQNMAGYRLMPGVLISVVIWGLVASAMSVYLAFAPSYTLTYGTLAGVIVTLLFFYITAIAIIFGAEVNAELNARRTDAVD